MRESACRIYRESDQTKIPKIFAKKSVKNFQKLRQKIYSNFLRFCFFLDPKKRFFVGFVFFGVGILTIFLQIVVWNVKSFSDNCWPSVRIDLDHLLQMTIFKPTKFFIFATYNRCIGWLCSFFKMKRSSFSPFLIWLSWFHYNRVITQYTVHGAGGCLIITSNRIKRSTQTFQKLNCSAFEWSEMPYLIFYLLGQR